MKMRKLLATAVAASLAVTSLATVASATDKTFDMGGTEGTLSFKLNSENGKELGKQFYLTDEEFEKGTKTLGITSDDKMTVSLAPQLDGVGGDIVDKNEAVIGKWYSSKAGSYIIRYNDKGEVASKKEFDGAIVKDTTNYKKAEVKMVVTGVKGSRGSSTKTYEYKFDNNKDGTFTLKAYAGTSDINKFLPEQFLEITKISFVVSGVTAEIKTDDEWFFNVWPNEAWTQWGFGTKDWSDSLTVKEGFTADDSELLTTIEKCVNEIGENGFGFSEGKTEKVYPLLKVTSTIDGTNMGRQDIWPLSETYASGSNDRNDSNDNSNQSYDGEDTTAGTYKDDFAGLASQVADFFNKQTNGTITFKFTTPAQSTSGSNWEIGGIPSTQTGLKGVLAGASSNDFALFFNYDKTGSLQAPATLDVNAGEVTFDISDILDSLGGQTMGVLDDIYYGLNKGIDYGDAGKGLYVESVTLAYDEDGDVDADIEEEDDDVEAEDDVDVEEDDDVEIEDDVEIDDDTTEEDDDAEGDAEGDVIVETEDDDANPGTGVALAVVPALVAAAAVVVSKKRS